MDDTMKTVLNMVYHAAVLGELAYGYTMLGESLLGLRPATIGCLTDSVKVILVLTVAIATKDFLIEKNIIPRTIDY